MESFLYWRLTSVLVTYEGEKVLEYRIVRATERANTIELPLRAAATSANGITVSGFCGPTSKSW